MPVQISLTLTPTEWNELLFILSGIHRAATTRADNAWKKSSKANICPAAATDDTVALFRWDRRCVWCRCRRHDTAHHKQTTCARQTQRIDCAIVCVPTFTTMCDVMCAVVAARTCSSCTCSCSYEKPPVLVTLRSHAADCKTVSK